jgi:uncharacterized membrane protein YedE/YeeE
MTETATQVASGCDYYGWACGMGSLVQGVVVLLGILLIAHWLVHEGYRHP